MEEQKTPTNETVVEFEDKKTFNLPLFLVWVAFVVSVLFLAVFWFSKNGMKSVAKEKQSEKEQLLSQIESEEYSEVAKNAEAIEVAVETLTAINNQEITTKKLLEEVNAVITSDVKIITISMGADDTLLLDGSTGSYRQVADLMMAIKSYERASEIKLGSVAASTDPSVSSTESVSFSISAKINTTLSIDNE